MPMETIEAFQDHGVVVADTVATGTAEARVYLARLEDLGISFRAVTDRLLEDGIAKFNEPFDQLLRSLEARRRA